MTHQTINKFRIKIKTLFLIISGFFSIIIFSNLGLAQSGWFNVNSGVNSDLNSIFFVDSHIGYAVGSNVILKSNNGGSSWYQLTINSSGINEKYVFKSVYFINASTGFVVGSAFKNSTGLIPPGQNQNNGSQLNYNIIFKTEDEGLNWTEQYRSIGTGLNCVHFIDSKIGCAIGTNTILHTINGGNYWALLPLHRSETNDVFTYKSVYFINEMTGYVVGNLFEESTGINTSVIYKTEDMGMNWNEIYRNRVIELNSIYFFNFKYGFAVGSNVILKTISEGLDWIEIPVLQGENDYFNFSSIFFPNSNLYPDPKTGWVVGKVYVGPPGEYSGVIFRTNDGGYNWEQQYRKSGLGYKSVFFNDLLNGWTTGLDGIILKTIDGGAVNKDKTEKIITDKFSLSQNFPNPFNPTSKIKFHISNLSNVKLVIYDILGKQITSLVNEQLKPGTYEVEFNGSNLSSGIYYYKLTAGNFTDTKRMLLIK
jgi:photosystem II stability/assembly factor-like uncharacterized protein